MTNAIQSHREGSMINAISYDEGSTCSRVKLVEDIGHDVGVWLDSFVVLLLVQGNPRRGPSE